MKTRQTSIDCYNEIKKQGLLSKRRFEVYEALLYSAPCTSSEAIRNANTTFGVFGVSSRFTELRDLGAIYEKGVKKCSITGRNVIEWDLTDRLPQAFIKKSKNNKQDRFKAAVNLLIELKDSEIYREEDWEQLARFISWVRFLNNKEKKTFEENIKNNNNKPKIK